MMTWHEVNVQRGLCFVFLFDFMYSIDRNDFFFFWVSSSFWTGAIASHWESRPFGAAQMEDILLTKKKKFSSFFSSSLFFLSVCLSYRNFWLNVSLWRWRRFWTFSLAPVSRDIHTVRTSIVSCLYTTRSPSSPFGLLTQSSGSPR